jgi:hypothetical protein
MSLEVIAGTPTRSARWCFMYQEQLWGAENVAHPGGKRVMGWERRPKGRPGIRPSGAQWYYYSARRIGSTVKKIYLGPACRDVATVAAQFDAEQRRRRAKERAVLEAERERTRSADAAADALESAVELLVEAAFLGAGYLQAEHGSWRRPRSWTRPRSTPIR